MLEKTLREVSHRYHLSIAQAILAVSKVDETFFEEKALIKNEKESKSKQKKEKVVSKEQDIKTILENEMIEKSSIKEDESDKINEDSTTKDEKDLDEKDLEEEVEETEITKDEENQVIEVSYSIEEQELLSQVAYGGKPLDYIKLFFGEEADVYRQKNEEQDFYSAALTIDGGSDMLTEEQAKESFKEIQYATMVGDRFKINSDQRHKFDQWIKFNKSLFQMYEVMHGMSKEVDYRPLI